MTKILNRVGMLISTTGQGTITAAVPISNKFLTPAEAGASDGEQYFWLLEEGNDFELFKGSWIAASTEISRDEVIASKIGGVAGTTKMTLAGGATLRSALPREGVAQGWTLIETIAATSGNNKVFDDIPDAYHDLMVVGSGVKTNASSAVTLDISTNNGSSYNLSDGEIIPEVTFNSSTGSHFSVSVLGSQLAAPIVLLPNTTSQVVSPAVEATSRINALRLTLEVTRTFTAGSLKLYGR